MIYDDHFSPPLCIIVQNHAVKRLTKSYKPWMDILFTINGHDFLQKLYDFGDTFILECLQKENNAFWKDVLSSWLNYIKTINNHPDIKDNFLNIPVWYNSNIKVANKTVFIKSWYEKGIKVLQDFFDEDCNLLVFEAFKCTYNLRNICIMQYNSITTAILKYLRFLHVDRTFVKLLPNPCIPIFFQGVIPFEKCTRNIYKLLNDKEVVPTAIEKWNIELAQYGVDNVSIKDVFKVCFKTTTDSSVQWLQFRILHRILPVGYYLRKINIKSLDNCGFCEKSVETIVHIFTTCDKIHTLWTELSLHIYRRTAVSVEFNLSNIIFGELPLTCHNKAINYIILSMKQYLFSSLMLKKVPTLIGFLCHFKVKFNVEKYAAIQSFKLHKFEKEWDVLKNILE